MGIVSWITERKLLSNMYGVYETVFRVCLCPRKGTEREKSPSHQMVSNGHLLGVRAWVSDAQILGPSCTPQDTWFAAVSMSSLCKFERKVQGSVFYVSCDGDNADDDLGGAMALWGSHSILGVWDGLCSFQKVTRNFWCLGCGTDTQQRWFSFGKGTTATLPITGPPAPETSIRHSRGSERNSC